MVEEPSVGDSEELNKAPLIVPTEVQNLYVDGFHGVTVINGVVRLNLTQYITMPDGSAKKLCVARLLMSPKTLQAISGVMNGLVTSFQKLGLLDEVGEEAPEASE